MTVTVRNFLKTWTGYGLLLIVAVVVAAAVAGCGGGSNNSGSASASEPAVEHISMQVLNGEMATEKGYIAKQDGLGHDTFMLTSLSSTAAHNPLVRSNLEVKVGDKIVVTVTNYDEGPHTFTAPELGVSATIAPAKNADKGIPSETTFTFTVKKAGKFRWFCTTPCDAGQGGWAMTAEKGDTAHIGYMAGYVVAS